MLNFFISNSYFWGYLYVKAYISSRIRFEFFIELFAWPNLSMINNRKVGKYIYQDLAKSLFKSRHAPLRFRYFKQWKKSFLSRGTGGTFTPPFHILKVAKIKQQCWLGPCNWRFFHKNCWSILFISAVNDIVNILSEKSLTFHGEKIQKAKIQNFFFPFLVGFCPRGHLMDYHLPNMDNRGHLADYHLPRFVHVVIEQPL